MISKKNKNGDYQAVFSEITPSNLPLIMAIEQREYAFPWSEGIFSDCLRHKNYYTYCLQSAEDIIGYCVFSIQMAECQLLNICVQSAYQGQGYGRKILDFVIKKAKWQQVEQVFLEVRVSNRRAIDLYQQAGFNEISIRKNYYPAASRREDACIMCLQLDTS